MSRRLRHAMFTTASICALAIALGACGSATAPKSAPPESAPASHAPAGFTGYKWSVVAIEHDGKRTPIPARYAVYLQFAPAGQFGANDPVNYHSGSYRQTSGGFTTSGIAVSAVGYAGHDPVVLLASSAISAFDNGPHASVRLTGDRFDVMVGGYTLTCQRDGTAAQR